MIKRFAPAVAYVAVGAGIFLLHSAWAALLGYHAGIVLILLIEQPSISPARLFKSNQLWLTAGIILLCASSGAALYVLWPVFSVIPTLSANLAAIGLTPAVWPVFIAYFALVNPWLEEVFWRGYLGNETKRLITNDIFFSGFHSLILIGKTSAASILLAFAMLAFAGWMWRQVAQRSGGLLTNVLAHMAADFTILFTVSRMCIAS